MPKTDDKLIHFAIGRGTNYGKAKNVVRSWRQVKDMLSAPVRTAEKFREYISLPQDEQVKLKSVNGWYFRTQVNAGRRNRDSGKPSDLITLDLDFATPEFIEDLTTGNVLPGVALCANSTRRHTSDKPRIRITIPVRTPIENDDYSPVSRIVAHMIDPDMTFFDKVSFRAAQMMFLPTASRDGEFFFHEQRGRLLDWQEAVEVFSMIHGDWRDHSVLPRVADEELRKVAEKAENPREKKGIVGDFCRAFDIFKAMDELIPGVYLPGDTHSSKPRFTYFASTSANGAVVEDDGDFLYSHHGSDPCADQLVNAWDMVRIHKFGHLDDANDRETPIGKRPSFKAMVDLAQSLPEVRQQQLESRYNITRMFTDADVEDAYVENDDDTPEDPLAGIDEEDLDLIGIPPGRSAWTPPPHKVFPPGSIRRKPAKDWHLELEVSKDGTVLNTIANVTHIVMNDLRLCRSFAFDEATNRPVIRKDLNVRMSGYEKAVVENPDIGDDIADYHITLARIMLSAASGGDKMGWGIKATTADVRAAVEAAARQNSFHSIKDRLFREEWDGESRCERLWIDYFGAEDNAYHRETARLFLVATVARVYEPGHKFDYVPIIEGPQGIGKSTFVQLLAMGFGKSLTANFKDTQKLFEATVGALIVELPELSSMRRAEVEDVKAYITQTAVTLRQAYGHYTGTIRRGFTLIGTTNAESYLSDRSGNRRFWPIRASGRNVDFHALRKNAPQIWAEARHLYLTMRHEWPKSMGDLVLTLSSEAEAIARMLQGEKMEENEVDVIAGLIADWVIRGDVTSKFDKPGSEPNRPEALCSAQIVSEILGKELGRQDRILSMHVAQALRSLGWVHDGFRYFERYGCQRAWFPAVSGVKVKPNAWAAHFVKQAKGTENPL
jgi:hypothetical protein